MYSKIVNPLTGRRVALNGRLGKSILRNYLNVLSGGASGNSLWDKSQIEMQGWAGRSRDEVDREWVHGSDIDADTATASAAGGPIPHFVAAAAGGVESSASRAHFLQPIELTRRRAEAITRETARRMETRRPRSSTLGGLADFIEEGKVAARFTSYEFVPDHEEESWVNIHIPTCGAGIVVPDHMDEFAVVAHAELVEEAQERVPLPLFRAGSEDGGPGISDGRLY